MLGAAGTVAVVTVPSGRGRAAVAGSAARRRAVPPPCCSSGLAEAAGAGAGKERQL